MRGDDHPRTSVPEGLQGRQAGPDPAVIGDFAGALVERDVQVGAQEHAPTGDALGQEVVEGPHQSDLPTRVVRSTRRLEEPPSLSYQPRTLTIGPKTFVSFAS